MRHQYELAAKDGRVSNPASDRSRPFDGARMLVIEDEFLIATLIEDALRRAGAHEVIVAMSAKDGLAALTGALPVDAAVIDIQLSDGSDAGYALAGAALKHNVPFVFLTGYSHDLTLPEPFSSVHLLTKPYEPQALVEAVGEAMRRTRAAPR